ncbi:MAG: hypothetical protein MMC33_001451 [Icmadophila ericetorum]|nr:hypothetical protein [Icmadophila ericetorum]
MEPPPAPPPHGSGTSSGIPKGSGLPPGNYDIFIIPPHSAGSGFLYLPSLQPHRNSFLAGVFCTLLAVAIWTVIFPVLRDWFATIVASGGMGVVVLLMGVGVAGWAWGKTQMEAGGPSGGTGGASNAYTNANGKATGGPPPHPRSTGSMPGASSAPPPPPPPPPQPEPQPQPQPSWQKPNPGPGYTAGATGGAGSAKTEWEKAREETRRKEEFRKRAEELRKKREEEEKAKARQREKDAREREIREQREKVQKEKAEKELKEKLEKEVHEKLEKEVKERVEKELAEKAKAEKAEREARLKEARERRERQSEAATESRATESRAAESRAGESSGAKKSDFLKPPPSPKKHQQPSASTAADDESSYSYRPYDKPKQPVHKATSASSVYSESSYAPSQSTARTTPPPSQRGPYHTKDPDKIVIKAVYSFNNTFTKLPIAQLVSGAGAVTDGLILRITTEGLFIDDDVRGVPQREWDVKAWTLKLIEIGEYKTLHVIRANVRDQEGKRYVFVLQDEENWKVAQGLQRLKRGTQVRSLGQSGMTTNETKAILENMGWA